jgi:hypothetical protein
MELTHHVDQHLIAGNSSNVGKSEMKTVNDKLTLFDRFMLTEFLFQELQEYLSYRYTHTDMNNILNVSRNLASIKKSNFYWKLKQKFSLEYYFDNYKTRGPNNIWLPVGPIMITEQS